MSLVELVCALTVAAGGVLGTVKTFVKSNDLKAATRNATADREFARGVFADLRGTAWSTSFNTLHAAALVATSVLPSALTGSTTSNTSSALTQTVSFPAADLTAVLGAQAAAGCRFRDINGDGIIDIDPAVTAPGLFPVRVGIQRGKRKVSYFTLVRTP